MRKECTRFIALALFLILCTWSTHAQTSTYSGSFPISMNQFAAIYTNPIAAGWAGSTAAPSSAARNGKCNASAPADVNFNTGKNITFRLPQCGTMTLQANGTLGRGFIVTVTRVSDAVQLSRTVWAYSNATCTTQDFVINSVVPVNITILSPAAAEGTITTTGSSYIYNINITSACVSAAITNVTAPSSIICASATQTLTANGVSSGGIVNWWTGSGGTGTNLGTGATLANQGPGTYYARVTTACDVSVAEASLTISTAANVSIGTQPVGATYTQMASATALSVSATGAGLSYLWYTCNADGSSPVSTGITTSTYAPSTASIGTTYYKCVVTGTCTTVTSDVVSVIVNASSSPTIGLTSGIATQSVTAGSAIGSIVYTWAGSATSANIGWSGSSASIPTGISATSDGGAKTITISGTPSVAGTYNYSVTSTDGSNTSSASTGSITVKLATPDVSSGATAITNQGFTAQWAAVSGVTNYTVKVYQGITEVVAARQTGVSGTSVAITGLSTNTSYSYKVTAIGDGALVPNSDESLASATVRTLNTAKAITAFSITGQQTSSIDEGAKAIIVYVPVGTDRSSLITSITVSANAGVSPASGAVQDFSSPVQYTVTAEDGSQQAYTVTVSFGTSATDYFRSKTSGIWSSASTWESSSDNSNWMNATLAPTKSSQGVLITGGRLISYSMSDSIPTTTINANDTLKAFTSVLVAAGKNLTLNGVYIHNLNAGTIPATSYKNTITWATGSTMIITGATAAAPTGIDQDFYNFIWNCTQSSAIGGIWSDTRHIRGNVTILSTGASSSNYLRFMSMTAGVTKKISIDGNLTLGGYVTTNGSSGSGVAEIQVNGNLTINNGCTFLMNNGSGASPFILDLYGNFVINSGGTFSSKTPGTDSGTLNFLNSGAQSFTNNGTFNPSLAAITVNVNNGSSLTLSSNLKANVLNVSPGAKLTNNAALTVTTFNLQSDATGTASYLETGSSTITTVNANQYLATGRNWYICSPVAGATSAVFNPAGLSNIVYWYDETHGSTTAWPQITDNVTGLNLMQGYVVNMAANGNVTFNGTLNSGSKNIIVSRTSGQAKEGFNLVGNPYPSYLDWDQVTKSNLQTSMWQRTKNSGDTYVFDTYNSTGQLAINNSGKNITNHIPPMQAFWVRVDNGFSFGSLTANNTMRSHAGSQTTGLGTVTDPVFKAPSQVQSVVRLEVSTGANTDEAVIYSNDNASNSFDAYDSPKMFNNSTALAEIYTLAGSEDLSINGLNTIPYDTEIPLGFSTLVAGTFSLKASQISNLNPGTQLILKDYANAGNPVIADLSDGSSYSFASDVSSNTSRFAVVFRAPSTVTGINSAGKASFWISTNASGQLMINGSDNAETSIAVYNAIGQRVAAQNLKSNINVLDTRLVPGVYTITLTSAGKRATTKVIIK